MGAKGRASYSLNGLGHRSRLAGRYLKVHGRHGRVRCTGRMERHHDILGGVGAGRGEPITWLWFGKRNWRLVTETSSAYDEQARDAGDSDRNEVTGTFSALHQGLTLEKHTSNRNKLPVAFKVASASISAMLPHI